MKGSEPIASGYFIRVILIGTTHILFFVTSPFYLTTYTKTLPKSRRAILSQGKLSQPSFTYAPPTPTSTITMSPGDLLFFPPGTWHSVASASPGLSINVSLKCKTYADIYCEALKGALKKGDERWRRHVTSRSAMHELINGSRKGVEAGWFLPPGVGAGCYDAEVGGGGEGEEDEDDDEEGGGELGDGDNVIDIDNVCPYNVKGGDVKLNPLSEVLTFEEAFGPDLAPAVEGGKGYVININYAGDEFYRSNLRFFIKCGVRGDADTLVESVRDGSLKGCDPCSFEAAKWLRWMGVFVEE